MSNNPELAASVRLRSTPFTPRVEAHGVSDYSIVNHTILPKGFGKTVDEDYWHLREHVQLWDVSCQRQVELVGPDAAKLAQLMTPRDLRGAVVGQCLYAPLIDENAGMINDPIILKLGDNHFWLSIADSDVLLWAKGLALGYQLNVQVDEPDVSTLAVQGPKADDTMAELFGNEIRSLRFFRFNRFNFQGHSLLIARSGYSKQGGFEIYLEQPELALSLWDAVWHAGQSYNIAPGSPNLIERVEGGLLSYGNEMTRKNNPLECGMAQYCQLDGSLNYIGYEALAKIASDGPTQQIRGIVFDGQRCPPCRTPWPLYANDPADGKTAIGQITTAIWSPRFNANIALGMLHCEHWNHGRKVTVACEDRTFCNGTVQALPLTDLLATNS